MVHSQDVIYLTRIIIFSAVQNVYLSILFLHFSLSVQLGSLSRCYACYHYSMVGRNRNFYTRLSRVSKSRSALLLCNYCTLAFYFVCCMALTLFICGNVELNPRPKNTKSYHFALCHWNFNSLPSHDLSKLSLIEAYNTHHNFDLIRLSETYLDSSHAEMIHD